MTTNNNQKKFENLLSHFYNTLANCKLSIQKPISSDPQTAQGMPCFLEQNVYQIYGAQGCGRKPLHYEDSPSEG